ncbi:hypothetical protein IFM89_024240 [Coptis chinensis]|uniref:Uncharacterized protein n=1 Tax=Coptis chinensis TaxID=261450 RepID=A0A835HN69_9MAGN|nr:hypothetical protein IFM89_024240 [Coptis chinensis]
MGLSTATLPSLHVPRLHQDFYPLVCGAALLIHTCRTARPYTHGIHPGRSHQLGIRTQAQAFKSKRLVAQANRVPPAPVIKGRPTQVQSAAAICASAFNVSCGATATQTLTRESSRTSTISDPRNDLLNLQGIGPRARPWWIGIWRD